VIALWLCRECQCAVLFINGELDRYNPPDDARLFAGIGARVGIRQNSAYRALSGAGKHRRRRQEELKQFGRWGLCGMRASAEVGRDWRWWVEVSDCLRVLWGSGNLFRGQATRSTSVRSHKARSRGVHTNWLGSGSPDREGGLERALTLLHHLSIRHRNQQPLRIIDRTTVVGSPHRCQRRRIAIQTA